MSYRKTPTEERKRAARLYDRGLSSREVADLVGCSPQSVLRWADLYGDGRRSQPEARKRAEWDRDKKREAADMGWLYVKLRSVSEVTTRVDRCRRTVLKYLQSEHNPFPYPLEPDEEIPAAKRSTATRQYQNI